MQINPIGIFSNEQSFSYDAGRQPDDNSFPGIIELNKGHNFEQALKGLEEFSHVWVIFQFDRNENWKPMVLPPRGTDTKVGVFATRSPYRPNAIGMSAVKLERIEGLNIYLGPSDLLDQTPILDIKPYLAYSDSISEANEGWLQTKKFEIIFSPMADDMLDYLEQNKLPQLRNFLLHQLEYEPTDERRKRVKDLGGGLWEISYRTWRASFLADEAKISIISIYSGYSDSDLLNSDDTYEDKELHRAFNKEYP